MFVTIKLAAAVKPWETAVSFINNSHKTFVETAVSLKKLVLESCSVNPMPHQRLAHISNTPKRLIQHSQDQDILADAYSPIAHGELLKNQDMVPFSFPTRHSSLSTVQSAATAQNGK